MTAPARRPSLAWCAVAAGIWILFAIGGPVAFVAFLFISAGEGEPFRGPGETEFTVAEPGTYVVWNDCETFFEGRSYRSRGDLPDGLHVTVADPAGRDLPTEANLGTRESNGNRQRISICSFEAAEPGAYRVRISGDFQERIFSVSRSRIRALLWALPALALVELVGWVVPIALVVWVFFGRRRASSQDGEGKWSAGPPV